jgi:TonB family protein
MTMARPSHLEHRFAALLSGGANRRPVTRWRALAGLGLVMLLVLPLGAMSAPRSNTSIEVRTSNLPAMMEPSPASNHALAVTAIRHVRVAALTANATAPRVLEYTTPPLYSDEARARGLEGIVTVEASVDVDGNVHVLRVLKGLGSGLDQNAVVALRQWRFVAGTRNGVPAEMHAEIDIEFTLRNEAVNLLHRARCGRLTCRIPER